MQTMTETRVRTEETNRVRDLDTNFKQPPKNLHRVDFNKPVLNVSVLLNDSSKQKITCDYYYG